jgi:hypothetical protein
MKWDKLGHVFAPQGEFPWMSSHAANPFAVHLQDRIFKIYFTTRDQYSRSHICSGLFELHEGFRLLELQETPVLSPGEAGLFDDSGVAMAYLYTHGRRQLLYYLGWNLKVTVPWLNTIGLAISKDGGDTFTKVSRVPIMDRSEEDPFSISYPCILHDQGVFRMWYGSNLKWGELQDNMEHVIKYAESTDLIHWQRSEDIHVNLMHDGEYALSKPFVKKRRNVYEMWYSYRKGPLGDSYRIGFARSNDGFSWHREDLEAGIDVSKSGWDSEMIEYPFVFDYQGEQYMLYNGNGYGATGFGLAVHA